MGVGRGVGFLFCQSWSPVVRRDEPGLNAHGCEHVFVLRQVGVLDSIYLVTTNEREYMGFMKHSPTSLSQFRTQELETRAFWSEEGEYGFFQIVTSAKTGEEIIPSIRLELYFDNKVAFLNAVSVATGTKLEYIDRKSEAPS